MNKLSCLFLGLSLLAACGDDNTVNPDAAGNPDAPPDAPDAFVKPVPFKVPLAAGGPDQLQSVAAGPNGTFYAAGFAAQTLTGPKQVVVVKMSNTGPIQAFGTGGVAITPVVSASGTAGEIDVAVQPDGKLIVTATVANAVNAMDRDIAVIRLDGTTGALDTTFGDPGDNGIQILDLNTALDASQAAQRDVSRDLAIGPGGIIYIYAASRNPGATATDSDFTVVKLSANGVRDMAFGGNNTGKFTLDIKMPADPVGSNATSRGIHVLADGSIIAGGYASSSFTGDTVQPVLFKLTPNGTLAPAFADGGVFHEAVLGVQTEIYNFAVHGANLVTGGYGRNSGTTNDFVSMRFAISDGERDGSWGGVTGGAVLVDPSGAALGSNCRNAIALPDGKTLLIGSTGPSNMPAQDAAFVVLDATGRLDTAYGTGIQTFELGSNQNDQFWGGAVSGNFAMVVGYQGGGATPTETVNDDSYGVVFELR